MEDFQDAEEGGAGVSGAIGRSRWKESISSTVKQRKVTNALQNDADDNSKQKSWRSFASVRSFMTYGAIFLAWELMRWCLVGASVLLYFLLVLFGVSDHSA